MLFTWLDEPILELTGRFQLRFLELQDMLVEVPQSEDGGHGIDGPLLGIRAFLRMFSSISVMQLGDIAFYGSVDSRHPSFPIEALGTDDYTPPSVQELNLCDGFPTSGWASLISSCIIFAPSASLLFTDQMGPSVLQNICEGQALSIVHLQLTLGKGISEPVSLAGFNNLKTLIIRMNLLFSTYGPEEGWQFLYDVLAVIPPSVVTLALHLRLPAPERLPFPDPLKFADLDLVHSQLWTLHKGALRSVDIRLDTLNMDRADGGTSSLVRKALMERHLGSLKQEGLRVTIVVP
ncbi:unnamed protein product [Somion occarium]